MHGTRADKLKGEKNKSISYKCVCVFYMYIHLVYDIYYIHVFIYLIKYYKLNIYNIN